MKNNNFLSLCSGCGGMDLGLEKAGFKCVGQIEKMDYALKVLNKQWKKVPKHTDILTFLRSDSPAKTYLKQTAKQKGLVAKEALSSLNVCDLLTSLSQLGYSLKMFPDSFQLTKEGTLQLSSKRFPKAGTGIRGEFWTVNTSEWPNGAKGSSLSDVLEECVHPKYYLSKLAVAGMIRRSKKWGRGGYVFLLSAGTGRIRQLRRLSLQRFESIVTGREALSTSGERISSRKRSAQPQEGRLPLYGKTLILRKLTPIEKEALQGLPKDWTLAEE